MHNKKNTERSKIISMMYWRLLKKDLKRKKTMNAIMLTFIILAAMFVASSANNMITVATALDDYLDMADAPDYWYATTYEEEAERLSRFTEENGYGLTATRLIQIDSKDVSISGETFDYGNTLVVSRISGTKIFDRYGNEITHVNDGEMYVTAEIFNSDKNNFYEGCKIVIDSDGVKKEFTLKGYMKDVLFGSGQAGVTRFIIGDSDFQFFDDENCSVMFSLAVYADDSYEDKFNNFNLISIMSVDRATIKIMYIMDILISAVILIVSICLILISMVILRFTINFTVSEEFREIGVMKAIGIPNGKIRGLYIIKYLAISIAGAAVGLSLSFPFGSLLLESVSRNIIISGKNRYFLNIIFAAATAAVVVIFCYLCTGKIKKFSPIDAIRNGETGERYSKKSFIRLCSSHLGPVPFMAFNDIFSEVKKYISMIMIFTLGILLIIIPINVINTLQSDKLVTSFSMADCDMVISQDALFTASGSSEEMFFEKHDELQKIFEQHNIDADVFQEILFRFNISHGDKSCSSLAFQGKGAVTADMYTYIEGTPPQNEKEVAISYIIADKIGAEIGDEVVIEMGEEKRKYIVTAINQSMNNLGEGIRFYQGDDIDYSLAAGCFGLQISYNDNPDKKTFEERYELLKKEYPDQGVYTAGGYISYMIGDIAGQFEGVKRLILAIIICINTLVSVLMVRSFVAKEKGEIAVLKAIGFKNASLVAWQTMRIGLILFISIIIGTVVSTPLTKLSVTPIFRIMGAYSIEYDIVPMDVYFVYPLTVLIATVLAAAAGAVHLRKIGAADTARAE